MRTIGFWIISIILCINFSPMLVQAQEQSPKVSINCSFPPTSPFDNTYGIGMDYHTPIECDIDNPSSYTIEIEISWEWQWDAELIDSEGESMDEKQQMNPNANMVVYIETDSPEYQKVGDYEIQISVIVTRYGLGQDAMYDCSDCEEETTSEIITIHPFYDYSNELIDFGEWDSEDWTYVLQDEYFYSQGAQFPDCPNGVYWKEYEISIKSNHDGYFTIDDQVGQPYQAWLLDSKGNKSTPFSSIEYLTGESLTFQILIEWNMNDINESLLSESILSYYPYSVYLWWSVEAFMDDTKYSNIKTYNPNYQLYEFSSSYIWQSRDTDYSLLERDMPCFIGEIVEYDGSILIIEDGGDYQLSSPSMISTIMIISVCALFFKRNKLDN